MKNEGQFSKRLKDNLTAFLTKDLDISRVRMTPRDLSSGVSSRVPETYRLSEATRSIEYDTQSLFQQLQQ